MPDAMLLVAHGSRSEAGQGEMWELARLVAAAAPDVHVDLGFLEMSEPPAGVVLDGLVAAGARHIVVVPLMLLAAGHSKSDVPAVVLEGRARHPGVDLAYGRPFGVDHTLLGLARRRLEEAGGLGLPLGFMARGTSDPDANAEAYKAGRLVAEYTGAPLVQTGFSGVTWPTVPETLDHLRRLGAERIATFAWFMATGVLVDRMRTQYLEFTAATGIDVVDAGYLAPDPALAALVLERAGEAGAGLVRMNCDTCAYRRPFPGLEDRVGQERGAGHSHLAAEHRGPAHNHNHERAGALE